MSRAALHRLRTILAEETAWTIAVSGGVDSMTLATLAHRHGNAVRMVHATSPAVPQLAGERVAAWAAREGWDLEIIDAGEFDDPDYRANPLNRCYFCKSNLYDGILAGLSRRVAGAVASGTNIDDLSDFRPGLEAARERAIRHPFVEADIGKAAIRALARAHVLPFADIPAQPCLASRVETGLHIEPADLVFIDALEQHLASAAPAATAIRVRLRARGVVVEADRPEDLSPKLAEIREFCVRDGRVFAGLHRYVRGSAFVARSEP